MVHGTQVFEASNAPSFSSILLTPEMARDLLEKRMRNRSVSASYVAKLARSIRNGTWRLTHQGIAVDSLGRLVDGQHRCMAVAQAGIAVPIVMVRYPVPFENVPIAVMDMGNKKTVGHVLEILGVVDSGKGGRYESIARALHIGMSGGISKIDETDVLRIVNDFRPEFDWALSLPRSGVLAPHLAAFAYCYGAMPAEVNEAASQITKKDRLVHQSPLWRLREHISTFHDSRKGGYRNYQDEFIVVLRTMQAQVTGKTIKQLKGTVGEGKGTSNTVMFWSAKRQAAGLKFGVDRAT